LGDSFFSEFRQHFINILWRSGFSLASAGGDMHFVPALRILKPGLGWRAGRDEDERRLVFFGFRHRILK
jgi:hypothetical protein